MQKGVKHIATEESRKLVAELYRAGVPQIRIAKRLDIGVDALFTHYRKELDENKDKLVAELATTCIERALNGDNKMLEFYLRTQGRWANAKDPEEISAIENAAKTVLEQFRAKKKQESE